MAFELVGGLPDSFDIEATVTAGTAIAKGDVLAINGNVLAQSSSSSTIHTILAVAAETISTSATKIKVTIIRAGQLWKATCNQTFVIATMRYETYALTDCTKIANDSTDVTGATGVFTALFACPVATECIGEFTRLQSTST